MTRPLLLLGMLALAGLGAGARAQSVVLAPSMTGLLGHLVESQSEKDIGRVIDVLVDDAGAPQAAVIDVGGFLGVGTRRIAVAWSALKFAAGPDAALAIALDISSDRIKAAPDYVQGKPVQAITPGATQ